MPFTKKVWKLIEYTTYIFYEAKDLIGLIILAKNPNMIKRNEKIGVQCLYILILSFN